MKKTLFEKIEPYLYLLPAFVLLVLFVYLPFVNNTYLSFNRVNQFREIRAFAGLSNYGKVLTDLVFWQSVGNTFVYVLVTVPLSIIIGFILASLARKKRRLSVAYEVLFALSMATSDAVIAMIFQLMYNPSFGSLNRLLHLNIDWLHDPRYALLSLMLIQIWHNVGYNFLFMLVAQRAIPTALLEGARLDGASEIKLQTRIILPMVTPMLFFLLIKDIAYGMTVANYTLILTDGGPNNMTQTIITYIYSKAIAGTNYNYAFAATVLGFLISGVMIALSMRLERKVHYN